MWKVQGPDGVVNGPFAVDGLGLGSQDDVGVALVDVLDDAGQARDVAARRWTGLSCAAPCRRP